MVTRDGASHADVAQLLRMRSSSPAARSGPRPRPHRRRRRPAAPARRRRRLRARLRRPRAPPAPRSGGRPARRLTPPAPSEFARRAALKDVYFDFDKYDIRPGDAKILDANAAWLKANDNLVLIEGHCDERGTNEYNLALGERRAKATMNYLVSPGNPGQPHHRSSATARSGRSAPRRPRRCWAKNRRAHFLVKAR